MKDISKFANVAGTPSNVSNALDTVGSSLDYLFAQAIVAAEVPSVLEEQGIVTVRSVPDPKDGVKIPIVRNTQFTWNEIDWRVSTNSLGSEFNTQAMNRVEYRKILPTLKTVPVFLPDGVSLLTGADNFRLHAEMVARDAKRKKEVDGLTLLTTEGSLESGKLYAAGGFTANGSVNAGSTLDPADLLGARRILKTGSDPVTADFALMHSIQYEQINRHPDFAPGATSPGAIERKARFNADGDIIRFGGMDIIESTNLPGVTGSATTAYPVDGHPVIVGKKGMVLGRGEKSGVDVHMQDDRIRHGTYIVVDTHYGHDILAKEAIVLIRTAD